METTMTHTYIATADHRGLLDIIDNLRSQGVSHYVDLPEIVVCGDQSAGKSSVLEAISGMAFPIKDGLCTRFATELILRRGQELTFKVSITPGESRFGDDKERLENWQPKASINDDGLGIVTSEAKLAMAEPASTGEFYEDILRIEVSGPEQPHLTMVDLPGLFRRGNKEQSDSDVGIVRGMVERYMARPRSIILTVVSAKYEYVLQEVTLMAKRADPDGVRTMGLITKPDTLDVGSDSEHYFVRLARNLEEELLFGWHVLKNRNFEEREVTLAQRDVIENEFFNQGLWGSIDSSHCGVSALRVKLSEMLRDQIILQLPSLVQDVEDGIQDCTDRLNRLGPVRGTPQQQLSYLLRVSEEYTSLMTQAVEGTYINPFFGGRKKIDKFSTRLRAVVQGRLREFAEEMRLSGQSQYIIDSGTESEDDCGVHDVPRISRPAYVEDVANRLKFSKGRELPGLFNPLVVNDLFFEQCEPWRRIARLLVEDIVEAVHLTTQLIIEHVTASDVTEGIYRLIRQEIDGLKVAIDAQVDVLLASAAQHPITYNRQLTENVQRIQQARHKHAMKKLFRKTFGFSRFDNPDSKVSMNPVELLDQLVEGLEPDMERFGSALAVDYMEAYYKIAMNRFIDDVSVLAIEDCLISKLPTLFKSSNVLEMGKKDISCLAGETQDSFSNRTRLETKRNILETGLQGLKSLHKRRNPSKSLKPVHAIPNTSEKPSVVTNRAESAPRAITPVQPSDSPNMVAMTTSIDGWPTQVESRDDLEDDMAPRVSNKYN